MSLETEVRPEVGALRSDELARIAVSALRMLSFH